MLPDSEFLNLGYICAVGVREQVGLDTKKRWEVYVRFTSGSVVPVSPALSRKRAKAEMEEKARAIMEATGSEYVYSIRQDDLVVMRQIVRLYVDSHLNGHVAMMEDTSGATYLIAQGDKNKCDALVRDLTQAIIHHYTEGASN